MARLIRLVILLFLASLCLFACNGDDDDDDDDHSGDECSMGAEYVNRTGDDDDAGDYEFDDDDDDSADPPVTQNPDALADAFRLFYKERAQRSLLSVNRFSMAGDAGFANAFAYTEVARQGDEWEVVIGPEGNNHFGKGAHAVWKLYQVMGGRDKELSLMRMFDGMVFNERVSGHSGLTTREALPGWTRVMDGIHSSVERTKWGLPVTPPVTFAPALEQEILDTFFDGVVFTYRENPEEYLFSFKAINELTTFALTYVFDQLDHDPPFLRVSDCCSSFMISQKGIWEGAYWGNHNSRDNFTDYALGFVAALEVEKAEGIPEDLKLAAQRAADAGRRTGDSIVENDNVLMTVDEWHDYETLSPAGGMNPDGEVEWQDLGSISTCQMAYVAHAISTEGLSYPPPATPLTGAVDLFYIRDLFRQLGLEPPPLPVTYCTSLDDALLGMTWGGLLEAEIFGLPVFELAEMVATFVPDLFPQLLGSMMDDFSELMLGSLVLCEYARVMDDGLLYDKALENLKNFIALQEILAKLVYGIEKYPSVPEAYGAETMRELNKSADEMIYKGAVYARMFGIDSSLEDLAGFTQADTEISYYENWLSLPDTTFKPLITDDEIAAQVEGRLAGQTERAPWRIERYRERFGYTYPVPRAGDGYECIGPDDQWMPTENSRHERFDVNHVKFWFEAALCVDSPETLDCRWAALGCAPADLDGSKTVDAADVVLFESAWSAFGEGADCSAANGWCDGADLDQNGSLDSDDQGYMNAAVGCWY